MPDVPFDLPRRGPLTLGMLLVLVALPSLGAGSEPTDTGKKIACVRLGALWAGGEAVRRGQRWDVSSCRPTGKAELVEPARRDPARWETARCNDGSPFGFEVRIPRTGLARQWVIHLQGGGFCDDRLISCARRPQELRSGPRAPDRSLSAGIGRGGIFSTARRLNPCFHDANQVFAHYCTSDLWSGALAERRLTSAGEPGWYFSGRLNVRAMFEVLRDRYGLDDSDPRPQVLFSGSSAGGSGVQATADVAAELLPRAAREGRLVLLNDGGVILDLGRLPFRLRGLDRPFDELLAADHGFWGASLNPRCEKAQRKAGRHPGRCFQQSVVQPFIVGQPPIGLGLPLLVQYSSLDSWTLQLFGIDPAQQPTKAQRWRSAVLQQLRGISWQWLFSGGHRPYHVILLSTEDWDMGPQGSTFRQVLSRFWSGAPPEQIIFLDDAPQGP